jgi:glycopeptide antibiotics resistance protein
MNKDKELFCSNAQILLASYFLYLSLFPIDELSLDYFQNGNSFINWPTFVSYKAVISNIILYLPWGYLSSLLNQGKFRSGLINLLTAFILSFATEWTACFQAHQQASWLDVILNIIGSGIGYFIIPYLILHFRKKSHTSTRTYIFNQEAKFFLRLIYFWIFIKFIPLVISPEPIAITLDHWLSAWQNLQNFSFANYSYYFIEGTILSLLAQQVFLGQSSLKWNLALLFFIPLASIFFYGRNVLPSESLGLLSGGLCTIWALHHKEPFERLFFGAISLLGFASWLFDIPKPTAEDYPTVLGSITTLNLLWWSACILLFIPWKKKWHGAIVIGIVFMSYIFFNINK